MVSSFYTSSSLRIGGLASGIDTDSIIKELMKAHRIPLNRLNQDKQILLWQQEDYRAIYDSLRTFRDKVFSMKLQATYLAKKASSSNEAAVTATANPTATPGTYTVTVNKLATGVSKVSQGTLPEETEGGITKTLKAQFNLSYDNLTFTLEGANGKKDFLFNTNTANIYTVVAEINAANLGITASYDATLNRFFLTTTSTGATAKIKVTNDPNNFLTGPKEDGSDNTLKLKMKLYSAGPPESGLYTGQDAEFDLNIGDATVQNYTSPTNTPTVAGITLNLKQADPNNPVTITVSNDTDAVFNAIKDFVNAYNEIIDKINGKLTEPRYRDYLPLTDEQREQLSDEQEKKWEEKARSGLLRGDSLLESVVSRMRATMSAVVPGLTGGQGYKTLAQIGITTLSYEERGKLYIDEAKLKDALQKDPDGVMNLFTKSAENYAEKGIAMRLYDDVNSAMALISARAGTSSSYSTADNSAIGRQIAAMNERISTMEERLQQLEDRYWRQFTAMEQAIQQMNAQSAWLAMQLGMGQGR
jgi:flagellar hook-associated protein 2